MLHEKGKRVMKFLVPIGKFIVVCLGILFILSGSLCALNLNAHFEVILVGIGSAFIGIAMIAAIIGSNLPKNPPDSPSDEQAP